MKLRVLAAMAVVFVPSLAAASSFYRPSEDAMIEHAEVIARVRVTKVESAKEQLGPDTFRISSKITLQPLQCLKGCRSDQNAIVIYEPGGTVGDQQAMPVDAPDYAVGTERLVFLSRGPENTLRTMNSGIGAIPLLPMPDGQLRMQRGVADGMPRTYDSFRDRLRAKVGLKAAEKPVKFAAPQLAGEQQQNNAAYRWLGSPGSKWRINPIPVVLPTGGAAGLGDIESRRAIVSAINAWEQSGAALSFSISSALSSPQGFVCQQGKLLISFDDPRSEIDDPQGCSGVLAIGGFCSSGVTLPDGFQTINAGAYVSNNGWVGCNFWSAADHRNFDEVSTHELGHAIGLGHSRESGEVAGALESDATMFWMAHFDGRAAGLRDYDRGAAAALYPGAAQPTASPSPEPTASPSPTPEVTASPSPTPEPTASPAPAPTASPGKCGRAADAGALFILLGCASLMSMARR